MCPPTFPEGLPCYLYLVVTGIAAVGWLVLIIFSRRPWANFWFSGVIVPLVLCGFYMYMLITFWWGPPPAHLTQFLTFQGTRKMLSNDGLFLVAWINILAMDLVVGSWMARKAAEVKMPQVYLIPCLIVTYIFAGFGFPMFAMALAFGKQWGLVAEVEDVRPTDSYPVSARPQTANTVR